MWGTVKKGSQLQNQIFIRDASIFPTCQDLPPALPTVKLHHQQINRCAVLETDHIQRVSPPVLKLVISRSYKCRHDELLDYTEVRWRMKSLHPAVFTHADVLPMSWTWMRILMSRQAWFRLTDLQTGELADSYLQNWLHIWSYETRSVRDQVAEHPGALLFVPANATVLQLC